MSMLAAGSCGSSGMTFSRFTGRACQKESTFSREFTVSTARSKLQKIARSSNIKVVTLVTRLSAKLHWFIYHDENPPSSRSKCDAKRDRTQNLIQIFDAALQHAASVRKAFVTGELTIDDLLNVTLTTHFDKQGRPADACDWSTMPDFEALQLVLQIIFKHGHSEALEAKLQLEKYISFILDFKNFESLQNSGSPSSEQTDSHRRQNYTVSNNCFNLFNDVRAICAFRKSVLVLIANQHVLLSGNQLFTIESLPERYFRVIELLDPLAVSEADCALSAISIGLLRRASSLSIAGLWLQDTLDATGRVRFEIKQATDPEHADEAFLRALKSVFRWQRTALLDEELAQNAAAWADRPYYVDLPALKSRLGIVHNFHSVAFYHIVRFALNWVEHALPVAALPVIMKLLALNYNLLDDSGRLWFQQDLIKLATSASDASTPFLLETTTKLLDANATIADSSTAPVSSLQHTCRLAIWKTIRFTDYTDDIVKAQLSHALPTRLAGSVIEPILV